MKTRQLKFRVWDKEQKCWIDIDTLWVSKNHIITLPVSINRVAQQFTGLKDKKGHEIYEGDIVFEDDEVEIGKIVYDESGGKFLISYDLNKNKINHDNSVYFSIGGDCNPRTKDIIVIGNIFENPELLK